MSKFDSPTDEKAWELAIGFPDYQVGNVQTCQWEALVLLEGEEVGTFGTDGAGTPYVGALVTEDDRGFVYVDYFTERKTAIRVHQEIEHAHVTCCLYDDEEWPELLFAEENAA
jgi:ABC-type Na+ transport system ATPase subunit NatA